MQTKTIQKYFLFSLLFVTFVFTFFIFQPFWLVLALGASFAVVLYPIYLWFNKLKMSNSVSAFITVVLFILVLCVPIFLISSIIFKESQDVYYRIIANGNTTVLLDTIGNKITAILPDGMVFNTSEMASTFVSFLRNNITNIFNTSLSTVLSLVLFFLAIFYFLKDGEEWKRKLILLSPLSDNNDTKILSRFSGTINGVIKQYLFIALIQGILMWIGLLIFGVPNAAFWGLVAAIFALIPPFGTSVVSVPIVIYLFVTGPILPAVGLLIWSAIMVGTIDNFLTPYIVAKKINMPPFLILFSVLGGISLLGPAGLLIGPLSVSMLQTLISIYKNESF